MVDADAVADAARSCPGVADLSSGTVAEFATYLPGRRVAGVRITDAGVDVHVVAKWDTHLPDVGEEVRAAVEPLTDGLPVSVYVEDIEAPA